MITIEQINSRLYNLSKHFSSNKIFNEVRLIDESKQIFFENNAIDRIRHWISLSENTTLAFDKALETFNLLLEYGISRSKIMNECIFLVNEMNKVRDANGLKNSLQYRYEKMHPRDIIHHNKDISHKTPKKVNKRVVSSADYNNTKLTPEQRKKMTTECYDLLFAQANKILEIDRIIENYNKISKRFNIDNIFTECSIGKRDIYDAIYSLSYCIGSYNLPFKNLYNSALECAWYGLQKKNINTSNQSIIETVTDYFIFSEGLTNTDIDDIKSLLEVSPIFRKEDFSTISYLENKVYDITLENVLDSLVGNYVPTEDDKENFIKEIQDFKKECSNTEDDNNILIKYKALTKKLLTTYSDQIPNVFSSIIQIARMVFIIYNQEDHSREIITILKRIVRRLFSSKVKCDDSVYKKILSILDNEVTYINNRLDKLKNEDNFSYEKYSKYIEGIKEIIDRYKSYSDSSEEDINEIAKISLFTNLINNISESIKEKNITKFICESMSSYPSSTIDAIVDFSIISPNILSKKDIRESLIELRDNLRKNPTVYDYIKIDNINENLLKLSSNDNYRYNSRDNLNTSILHLLCLNELKYLAMTCNSKYFNESSNTSFENTVNESLRNFNIFIESLYNHNSDKINSIVNYLDNNVKSLEKEKILSNDIWPLVSKAIKIALLYQDEWLIDSVIALSDFLVNYFSSSKRTIYEQEFVITELDKNINMCNDYITNIYKDNSIAINKCEIIKNSLIKARDSLSRVRNIRDYLD